LTSQFGKLQPITGWPTLYETLDGTTRFLCTVSTTDPSWHGLRWESVDWLSAPGHDGYLVLAGQSPAHDFWLPADELLEIILESTPSTSGHYHVAVQFQADGPTLVDAALTAPTARVA
jgi:hypothetical protein